MDKNAGNNRGMTPERLDAIQKWLREAGVENTRTETQSKEADSTAVFVSETKANHAESMAILQQNGSRPMTYQEALMRIDRDPQLKEQLKGKWFWLEGKGLDESEYYTFDNEGNLTEGKGDIEKTVYAWSGENPLSLDVHTDDGARFGGGRFILGAVGDPQVVASVVVGIRVGHEAAAPKLRHQGR